ncbi:MAG: hypothetical protein U9Q30_08905, partial [Campylobacterota bacterium]|nr:hypothetical protein [Campylobacterota bacterium]
MTELEQIKQENEKLKQLLIQNGIIKKDKAKAFSDVDMSYLDSLGIIKEVFGQKSNLSFCPN